MHTTNGFNKFRHGFISRLFNRVFIENGKPGHKKGKVIAPAYPDARDFSASMQVKTFSPHTIYLFSIVRGKSSLSLNLTSWRIPQLPLMENNFLSFS